MSLKNQFKVLIFAGRVGMKMVRERFGSALWRTADFIKVPTSAEILSPRWLTAILCRDHAGAKVVEVKLEPFHALAFGLFTIGRGFLQAKMQSDEYCLQSIKRCTQMMADLNSLDSLEK